MNPTPPIRKHQYVLAVARELHFRRAAERLSISQPFMSRKIKEFETEVGFDIFRRNPVSLTESGRVLVIRLRQMMEQMESDFRKAIDADHAVNHRNAQEFTIAHSAYISLALRQKIRNIQKAKFPHLQLGFRILFALDLFEALDSGQVQAGVTFAPLGRQDFTHISLRSETCIRLFREPILLLHNLM
jgi:DNA-binding transcriptional LysR family regulator